MAKPIYKSGLDVAGMSVDDILKLDYKDLQKLNRRDLSRITSRLASAGNKRLKRAKEKGVTSPAYESVARSGGKFSVAGKNLNQLRAEFARARRFLSPETKTSTIKGAKKYKKKIDAITVGLTEDEKKQFFKIVEELKNSDPMYFTFTNTNLLISEEVREMTSEMDSVDLLNKVRSRLENVYEESERVLYDTSGQFAELFDDLPPVGN